MRSIKAKQMMPCFVLNLLLLNIFCLSPAIYGQYASRQHLAADLGSAATWGNVNDVKSLLTQGAPVNGLNFVPLIGVAQAGTGSYRARRTYRAEKSQPTYPASQYIEIAKLLLNRGADVNAIEPGTRSTALMEAASSGVLEMVELLLNQGAQINARDLQGTTALMIAASYNSEETVELLVKRGAQVKLANHEGYTALMAASLGQANIVEFLLSQGAQVNVTTRKGATALMLAADAERYGPQRADYREVVTNYADKTKIINLLLGKGARINAQTKSGTTALLRATHRGASEAVQLLLAKGADLDIADKQHGTPVHLAVRLRDKWLELNQKYQNGQWIDQELQAHRILAMLERAKITLRQPH